MNKVNQKANFAKSFKELRIRDGLTQEQCAELLDCTAQYISQLENGHKLPSSDFIIRSAELFNIDPGQLFKSTGIKTILKSRPRSSTLFKINKVLETQGEKKLEKVYRILKTILKEL